MLRKELEMLMHLQHPYIVQTVGLEPVDDLGMCIVTERKVCPLCHDD